MLNMEKYFLLLMNAACISVMRTTDWCKDSLLKDSGHLLQSFPRSSQHNSTVAWIYLQIGFFACEKDTWIFVIRNLSLLELIFL